MIAVVGVTLDFATSQVGLARGFPEGHLLYSPVSSLVVFWALLVVATRVVALPRGNVRLMLVFAIAWF